MGNKYFGVMIDMSRNAVMNVKEVKEYAKTLKSFGYNMIQLYTEDTYEIEGEPFFGYMRGRYSKDELKEIVNYCEEIGMEVIPCIQTLAHVNQMFRWMQYWEIKDTNDIMLVGEERTYSLIEKMFQTLKECFKTKYVHIGMDEAHMVGLGKYLDKNGYRNRFEIISEHLKSVIEIANKYGFHPMMWSDMFFRLSNHGEYYSDKPVLTEDAIKNVPNGVDMIYWDYYTENYETYLNMFKEHKKLGGDTWFAGGAWMWNGFTPSYQKSFRTMKLAIKACRDVGIDKIMFTLWGDNGAECSRTAMLGALFAFRKMYDGIEDMDVIAEEFNKLTGENFYDFTALDEPNLVCGNTDSLANPSKWALYNDLFLGFLDSTITQSARVEYNAIALKMTERAKRSKKYGYIFETYAKLCCALAYKYDLGYNIRKAYQNKDKDALKKTLEDIENCAVAIREFYKCFNYTWMKENKPFGLEVIEIRIGGVLFRMENCAKRIKEFIEKDSPIEELDIELVDFFKDTKIAEGTMPGFNSYIQNATPNNL